MVTTVTTEPRVRPQGLGGGPGDDSDRRPDGGSGGGGHRPLSPATYRLGMWIGLASISMLFMGLTSAYIVRQGLGGNWRAIQVPSLLWLTTAILLASSLTLELARRALKRGFDLAFNRWMLVTTGLGVGFLIGQLLTWGQLRDQGIYISTTPHSSFFYLLTGAHGVHLLGGVIALTILDFRFWIFDWRHGDRAKSKIRNPKSKMELAVDLTAVYWHFMAGLWVYLFVLLFVWR